MGVGRSCFAECGARGQHDENHPAVCEEPTYSTKRESAAVVDRLYSWIRPDEALQIRELRNALTPLEQQQLAAAPEDIKHDLMFCRFLRGHDWEVPKALKAFRGHLGYRREFRDVIEQSRARFPADTVDYKADRSLYAEEMESRLITLQLPADAGTNDGMPVSLFVARLLDLSLLTTCPESQLIEWFVSCLEQRNLVLHKQSLKERRMARVMEVRDMMGFKISQIFTWPSVLRKVVRVFKNGEFYPELMGRFFLFNLEPGGRAIQLIKSVVPKRFADKVMYAECGDWTTCCCSDQVLSPAMLPTWVQHIHDWARQASEVLTSACPRAWRALEVCSGDEIEWEVCCKGIVSHSVGVNCTVWLFEKDFGGKVVCRKHGRPDFLRSSPGNAAFKSAKFKASTAGVVLLEVDLQEGTSAGVALALFPAGTGQGVSAASLRDLSSSRMEPLTVWSDPCPLLLAVLCALLSFMFFILFRLTPSGMVS